MLSLNSQNGLTKVIFENQASLHALGVGICFTVPTELGDALQLGHDKIIAEIEA